MYIYIYIYVSRTRQLFLHELYFGFFQTFNNLTASVKSINLKPN